MGVKSRQPTRSVRIKQDLGAIPAIQHNDAAGANKMIMVDPAIIRTTIAGENVGAGKLVKISATPYTLELKDKAYAPGNVYQKGDVTVSGGRVYLAQQDNITGAFDATKWQNMAPSVVAAIPSSVGAVVPTGRWHNSVSVSGFLVDDDSSIDHIRIRD